MRAIALLIAVFVFAVVLWIVGQTTPGTFL